ncbi:hypothetical protein HY045_03090 [Candidatus Woesebacteria bacterium]|nr:hypothetical protein [Candidatus Woesebacteria bacterium]
MTTEKVEQVYLPYDWSEDSTPKQRGCLIRAFLQLNPIERFAYSLIKYDPDIRLGGLPGAIERCDNPAVVEFITGGGLTSHKDLEIRCREVLALIEKELIESLVQSQAIASTKSDLEREWALTTIMLGLYDETTRELRDHYPSDKSLNLELMMWQRERRNLFSKYIKGLSAEDII